MSVTIVDIAKRAKVAPSTVSRALTGKGRIAAKTRNRIVQIAQEMGYEGAGTPTAHKAVCILYSRRLRYLIGDAFYGAVMEGVEISFRAWGYRVFFSTFESQTDLRALLGQGAHDGFIVVGGDATPEAVRPLAEAGTAVVLVDNEFPDHPTPAVVTANFEGSRMLTRHLLALGHRKIAYVAGPLAHISLRQRVEGFKQAMAEATVGVNLDTSIGVATGTEGAAGVAAGTDGAAGVPTGTSRVAGGVIGAGTVTGGTVAGEFTGAVTDAGAVSGAVVNTATGEFAATGDGSYAGIPDVEATDLDSWIVPGADVDFGFETGVSGFHEIWNVRGQRPTAILCSNDMVALGVLHAAKAEGLSIPGDLSVAGFDDVVTSPHPQLTTVRVPCREIGLHAARLLYEAIAGPIALGVPGLEQSADVGRPSPVKVVLYPELRVRESTAPPPSDSTRG